MKTHLLVSVSLCCFLVAGCSSAVKAVEKINEYVILQNETHATLDVIEQTLKDESNRYIALVNEKETAHTLVTEAKQQLTELIEEFESIAEASANSERLIRDVTKLSFEENELGHQLNTTVKELVIYHESNSQYLNDAQQLTKQYIDYYESWLVSTTDEALHSFEEHIVTGVVRVNDAQIKRTDQLQQFNLEYEQVRALLLNDISE